jgi:hypothetical protein
VRQSYDDFCDVSDSHPKIQPIFELYPNVTGRTIEERIMVIATNFSCVLDQHVVNNETISELKDIGLSFFASLCGRNRGIFVLRPSDGQTWGCTSLPPNFASLAGASDTSVPLKDVNAIKDAYLAGNMTASDTIKVLDYFVKSVYWTSANVATDPYACNLDGLAKLQCDLVNTIPTIRSVTLAGLFTPALWATKGRTLSLNQTKHFYSADDFAEIRALGLNTVQIPIPMQAFVPDHDESITEADEESFVRKTLTRILDWVDQYNLQAILLLEGLDNDDAVTAAAHYAADHPAVLALTVPSTQSMKVARAAEPSLKLMVTINESQLVGLSFNDPNVFASLALSHASTVADVASSSSLDDRMKLFYHEATACLTRAPLEFSDCVNRVPIFVQSGFDVAIDDCINQHTNRKESDVVFVDYGQCHRWNETIDSPWWERHRSSLVARQLFSYEHGLGWSFSAWKLYNETDVGVLDKPEKLLSLKDIVGAGLFPSLSSLNSSTPARYACLNPPLDDFIMGDQTFAPTMAPPPDCGNGWWNFNLSACEYWIPPMPTIVPTMAPISCPEVEPTVPCSMESMLSGGSANVKQLVLSAGAGGVLALVISAVVTKYFSRRGQYTSVPDSAA